MAIQYKLYKAKRNDKFNGKIYARATYNEMFDLKMLAQHMANHDTNFSRGQILGVLTDMVTCTQELCLQGKKVKLDNLGIFYVALESRPADSVKEFNVKEHIQAVHIRFLPSGESATKVYEGQALLREKDEHERGLA